MDIAATKLELMQHLMSISDPKTLKRVAVFFKKEVPKAAEEEDDISDEEFAAFEDVKAQRDRGEVKFLSEKEHMAEVRRLTQPAKRSR